MRKGLMLVVLLLLLTSCFKSNEDEKIDTATENITNIIESNTNTEEGIVPPNELNTSDTTSVNVSNSGVIVDTNIDIEATGEIDSKTEDQIVKEFEAEIDSLFNLIDEDGKN